MRFRRIYMPVVQLAFNYYLGMNFDLFHLPVGMDLAIP